MTNNRPSSQETWRIEVEEIAELLPAPANWDMPRERYIQLREELMRRIDHD
ncbi:hypothetical protein OG206_31755 [Streptomyces sp. NBC_01341]|uniref:hypothetical protein n=1 Tax=Streptomyces sp. NBC_01341 TaxID=2903831 RepID=UPI002E1196B2|nr:hypothetical protein OG206_31755 [Streptomyces sp. NBC_01341]